MGFTSQDGGAAVEKNAFWCFLNGSFNPNGIYLAQNVGTQSISFYACGNVFCTWQRLRTGDSCSVSSIREQRNRQI